MPCASLKAGTITLSSVPLFEAAFRSGIIAIRPARTSICFGCSLRNHSQAAPRAPASQKSQSATGTAAAGVWRSGARPSGILLWQRPRLRCVRRLERSTRTNAPLFHGLQKSAERNQRRYAASGLLREACRLRPARPIGYTARPYNQQRKIHQVRPALGRHYFPGVGTTVATGTWRK